MHKRDVAHSFSRPRRGPPELGMGIPNVPTLLYLCMYVPLIFMAIHR